MWWWRIISHPGILRAGGIAAVLCQARLSLRLLRDERVPAAVKLVAPATLLYLISPINLIPNLVPLVGPLDDLGVLLLGMWLFIKLCPRPLVEEHRAAMRGQAPVERRARQGDVIDAEFRPLDESPRAR